MLVNFADRLVGAVKARGNAVMVGIDPRPAELPPRFLEGFGPGRSGVAAALEAFGRGVVDAVSAIAPAVKFQSAFYEAYGPEGVAASMPRRPMRRGVG